MICQMDFYNIGISMINMYWHFNEHWHFNDYNIGILMIDISKIFAWWISFWVENDLGGFWMGGFCLQGS